MRESSSQRDVRVASSIRYQTIGEFMEQAKSAGKLGRAFMSAVLVCTLCMPTQALAAQASSGSSASSAKSDASSGGASQTTEGAASGKTDSTASDDATSGKASTTFDGGSGAANDGASADSKGFASDGSATSSKAASGASAAADDGDATAPSSAKSSKNVAKASEAAAASEDGDSNDADSADGGTSDTSDTSGYIVDWTTANTCEWSIDSAGKLVVRPQGSNDSGMLSNMTSENSAPWNDYRDKITSVVFEKDIETYNDHDSESCLKYMFADCVNLVSADLSKLRVGEEQTTPGCNLEGMFKNCTSLVTLDLSNFQTRWVVNSTAYMFSGCSKLQTLDISALDTLRTTNMTDMFDGCSALCSVKLGARFSFEGSKGTRLCNLPTPTADGYSGKWTSSLDSKAYEPADIVSPHSETTPAAVTYTAEGQGGFIVGWQKSGTCEWSIDGTGKLLVRTTNPRTAGQLQDEHPWSDYASQIVSVGFETGASGEKMVSPAYDGSSTTDTSVQSMFSGCTNLKHVDMSGFDTSKLTNLKMMFYGCTSLESLDLSSMTVSNVETYDSMFENCSSLVYLNLSGLGTSADTTSVWAFNGCGNLRTLVVSKAFNWGSAETTGSRPTPTGTGFTGKWVSNDSAQTVYDPDSLPSGVDATYSAQTDGSGYIVEWTRNGGCEWSINADGRLEVRVADGASTGTLVDAQPWIGYIQSIKSVLIDAGVCAGGSAEGMFKGCENLQDNSVDLTNLDTSGVSSMKSMFEGCSQVQKLDLSSLKSENVIDMSNMFKGCTWLDTLDISGLDTTKVTSMDGMFDSCDLKTIKLGSKFSFEGAGTTRLYSIPTTTDNWYTGKWVSSADSNAYLPTEMPSNVESTYTAEYETPVSDWKKNGTCDWSIDAYGKLVIKPLDDATSGTLEDASPWSDKAAYITSVVVKEGVSAGTSAKGMFEGCSKLAELDIANLNLNANVTDMSSMFKGCSSLKSIDLQTTTATKVTDFSSMFEDCTSLEVLNIWNLSTQNATSVKWMFENCSSLKDITYGANFGFTAGETTCRLPDPSKDKGYSGYWLWVSSTRDTGMEIGSKGYSSDSVPTGKLEVHLQAEEDGDWTVPWTVNGTAEWAIRWGSLLIRPTDGEDTGRLADASPWKDHATEFQSITVYDTVYAAADSSYMFDGCTSLTDAYFSRSYAFNDHYQYSKLDLSEVRNLTGMFRNCTSLEKVSLASNNSETKYLATIKGMFEGCTKLGQEEDVYLGTLSTVSVTDMSGLFKNCSSLKSVTWSENNSTTNVQNMSEMFSGCTSLSTLDLSKMETTAVTDFGKMFYGCSSIASLDLTSMSTGEATAMTDMFTGCTSLITVKLGETFAFEGSGSTRLCSLPDPTLVSPKYTGKWMDAAGETYTSSEIPSKTSGTYNAVEKNAIAIPEAATNLTYTGAELAGVPDGEGYTLSGTPKATESGTYEVTVTLSDSDANAWSDGTIAPKAFTWTIAKAKIAVPTAKSDLVYDGTEKSAFDGVDPWGYTLSGDLTGTNAGTYKATATLTSTKNHEWDIEGTDEEKAAPQTIEWSIAQADPTFVAPTDITATYGQTISDVMASASWPSEYTFGGDPSVSVGNVGSNEFYFVYNPTDPNYKKVEHVLINIDVKPATVQVPVAKTDLVYSGQEQTGVSAGDFYTISGNTATNAGSYTATATLTDSNHAWSDGSTTAKTITWEIGRKPITAPSFSNYTYDGGEKIGVPSGEGYTLGGIVSATNAGTYTATAKLDDADNCEWADGTTANREITWSIAKAKIDVPTANTGLAYTGEEQTGVDDPAEGAHYALEGNKGTTARDDYEAIAKLSDAANYEWNVESGDASADQHIPWSIAKAKPTYTVPTGLSATYGQTLADVELPDCGNGSFLWDAGKTASVGNAGTNKFYLSFDPVDTVNYEEVTGIEVEVTVAKAKIDVPTAKAGLTYTGKVQEGVANGEGYTRSGAYSATDAGTYKATVTPDANHAWSDGSTTAKTVSWTIARAKIAAPTAKTGLTYTGKVQVGVANGEGYTRSGAYSATDAGSYKATVTLDANHEWSDGSTVAKTVSWSIARAKVAAPVAKTGLVANGKKQTGVAAGEGYTLSGKVKAKKAGTYTATATLDKNHAWSDGSTKDKQISWSIQSVKNAKYQLTSVINGKLAIGVKGASKDAGAKVVLARAGKGKAKRWAVSYDSKTGYYTVKNVKSGKVLGVKGKAKAGAKLVQQASKGKKKQLWSIEEVDGGYVLRSAANSKFAVAVPGGKSATAGTNLQLAKFSKSAKAQKFTLK